MEYEEYVGAITMEVNGLEIAVVSLGVTEMTGREPVAAMTRGRRIVGYSEGITTYSLEVSALLPKSGEKIDWANITNAVITAEPVTGGERQTFVNCSTTKVGSEFKMQGQAGVSISMFAQDKIAI